ncbi:MAG: precorrin-6y C5,15-methyltransferase (decarboxylating) subunit CbiE [Hyphomicrobiaceae bacterium]
MSVWLTIVGCGLGGREELSAKAKATLEKAEVVAGSERLLNIYQIPAERRFVWTVPFTAGVNYVVSRRGRPTVVLATGDPMHFGVGATLASVVSSNEMCVLSAPSAFSLAAARLGWPLQDATCLSLHGRPLEGLYAELGPGALLLILTSDGQAPAAIMELLTKAGYGHSRVVVLENLGGHNEARYDIVAADQSGTEYADLNVLAITCVSDPDQQYFPAIPGLPDTAFLHDGQLTKREIRAVTLAGLMPTHGQRLWDVGAGCGSVAIEWLRAAARSAAVAFEREEDRCAMIEQNALGLGVPRLAVVKGEVPISLVGQPPPDAIFHGGAVSNDSVFEACWRMLLSGGRLVANAVTLEGETALARRHAEFGGELIRMSVARSVALGRLRGMQPSMDVTQWRVLKP